MTSIEVLTYVSFGYSFIAGIIPFAESNYLWKKNFFNKCLVAAIISGIVGLALEANKPQQLKTGLVAVIMFSPLIYLSYFQFFRWLFKKWTGTEPYITSSSSMIGGVPLDMFSSTYTEEKSTKYPKDRKIMLSDFVVSFLQALVPIFTILGLIFLVVKINK